MRLPSLRSIAVIYRKEMLDLLRDKRTLYGTILLPILIYPLLTLGFSNLLLRQVGRVERQVFAVRLVGGADLPELDAQLAASAARWDVSVGARTDTERLHRDLAEGRAQVLVEVPPEAARRIESGETVELRAYYNGADENSLAAWRQFHPVLERAHRALVERRLRGLGVGTSLLDPFRLQAADRQDVSTPEQRGSFLLGRLVCVLLVMMAAVGAFYPAVDAASGEKERGTMQTLLVSPALRSEIVLGKYFAVLTLCLATSALNLASMGLTFSVFTGTVAQGAALAFAPTPGSVALMLFLLLPLGALFSAVALGISAFASSYKEAMLYLSPFLLVAILGSFAPLLPGLRPSWALGLVPVVNGALALYQVVQGAGTPAQVVVPFVANVVYAALALGWVAWVFRREDVLLRGPVEFPWGFRKGATAARPHPSVVEGIVFAGLLLALTLFLGTWLRAAPFLVVLYATQLGAILLPLLAVLVAGGIDARRALSLRFPGWTNLAVAVLTAAALNHVARTAVRAGQAWDQERGGDETEVARREMEPLVDVLRPDRSPAAVAAAVVAMAALAPLCEEMAFRGLLLSSLRPVLGPAAAVILPGLLFGAMHGSVLPRWIALALVGCCFGAMVVRTGSLWVSIAAHAMNNAFTLALVMPQLAAGRLEEDAPPALDAASWGVLGLAVAVVILGLWLLSPAPALRPGGRGPDSC